MFIWDFLFQHHPKVSQASVIKLFIDNSDILKSAEIKMVFQN